MIPSLPSPTLHQAYRPFLRRGSTSGLVNNNGNEDKKFTFAMENNNKLINSPNKSLKSPSSAYPSPSSASSPRLRLTRSQQLREQQHHQHQHPSYSQPHSQPSSPAVPRLERVISSEPYLWDLHDLPLVRSLSLEQQAAARAANEAASQVGGSGSQSIPSSASSSARSSATSSRTNSPAREAAKAPLIFSPSLRIPRLSFRMSSGADGNGDDMDTDSHPFTPLQLTRNNISRYNKYQLYDLYDESMPSVIPMFDYTHGNNNGVWQPEITDKYQYGKMENDSNLMPPTLFASKEQAMDTSIDAVPIKQELAAGGVPSPLLLPQPLDQAKHSGKLARFLPGESEMAAVSSLPPLVPASPLAPRRGRRQNRLYQQYVQRHEEDQSEAEEEVDHADATMSEGESGSESESEYEGEEHHRMMSDEDETHGTDYTSHPPTLRTFETIAKAIPSEKKTFKPKKKPTQKLDFKQTPPKVQATSPVIHSPPSDVTSSSESSSEPPATTTTTLLPVSPTALLPSRPSTAVVPPPHLKDRLVKSARKLLTAADQESQSNVQVQVIPIYYPSKDAAHPHKIRLMRVFNTDTNLVSMYAHAADLGGVVERKSNISRLFGKFESPSEKLLMVTNTINKQIAYLN